jgi:tRNA (guanine37-N1)-methyltransferase
MFSALTQSGITRRALEEGLYVLNLLNPRDFTADRHRTVDDRPYGGGPGMVMLAQPLEEAINFAKDRQKATGVKKSHVVLLTPQGYPLQDKRVRELKELEALVLLAGDMRRSTSA